MGVGWTSIGTLSEVWVGGRRDVGSDSDWGEHLRTTGPGPHTTMDLTQFFRSHGLLDWTTLILSGNKTNESEKGICIRIRMFLEILGVNMSLGYTHVEETRMGSSICSPYGPTTLDTYREIRV